MNIFDILDESSLKWGGREAIIVDEKVISYNELFDNASLIKNQLISNGVVKGSAISIISPNGIDFVTLLMAAAGTGAVVMPIFHKEKPKEIDEALKKGQVHYFISLKNSFATYGVLKSIIKLDNHEFFLYETSRDLKNKTASFIEDPCFMRFTSGTTGNAKGVIISHQSVMDRIKCANEGLMLNEKDKVYWVLPMAFHFVVSIVLFLKYGITIVVNTTFSASEICDNIIKNEVTFLYGSPMYIKLLNTSSKTVRLPTLKKVISTSYSIAPNECTSFFDKYNIPVTQAFGIIEVGLPIINTQKLNYSPESVGYSLPSYSIGILDAKYEELGENKIGLLGIKGPGMFDAYLSPPTLRNDILINGWFITGDYAVRNKEGLITIKGREKNVINVSGNKVFPYEVENVVNSYPGVVKAKAYSKNHVLLGEIVAVYVVKELNKEINEEDLINFSRNFLSDYKVPQMINFVPDIKMTSSGKIKR